MACESCFVGGVDAVDLTPQRGPLLLADRAIALGRVIVAVLGDGPVYVSIDVDGFDPAYAPGTGTPEIGGILPREGLQLLRGLSDLNVVGGDVVEVAPAYDHAELTSLAAATVVYELVNLFVRGPEVPRLAKTASS